MASKVDENKLLHQEDNEQSESEGEQEEDEDFDTGIKDDILRPASTRSKIVVNLREPGNSGRR